MYRLIVITILIAGGAAGIIPIQATNVYTDECPGACRTIKYSDLSDLQACQDAVMANDTSTCVSVGTYDLSGTDTLTYLCTGSDETYKYYAAYLPALKELIGDLTKAALTANVTLTKDCILYQASRLKISPRSESSTCQFDTVDLNKSSPYISIKAEDKSVMLPEDFVGIHYLIANATDTGCDALEGSKVSLSGHVVYTIAGDAVEIAESSSTETASGSGALYAIGFFSFALLVFH
eukprot:Blabericola_migrator_1__71@NODE_1018_length_5684_cov_169_427630_g699_i0_p2_GENE_NODE_1018_length_5684_cov_169_427630_g699_i0NODE_1018_length_5684_cov_169_427630_g699_i0_p2_ORF_typecomplete_len236_score52_16_NODE_1018_length_5684_cov_169_427630_g699_i029263633